MQIVLTNEILLAAYAQGLFPMAQSAHSPYVHWYCPEQRGQLSIENLHIPKKLMKSLKRSELNGAPYDILINYNFQEVIEACAENRPERPETWINDAILKAYCNLHKAGHAHSVECRRDNKLIGGLYGVSLGAAFFGESIFSRESGAGKVCLIHLAARLHYTGFKVLDTQFVNDHLKQFGVYEVSYKTYMKQLKHTIFEKVSFTDLGGISEKEILLRYLENRGKQSVFL